MIKPGEVLEELVIRVRGAFDMMAARDVAKQLEGAPVGAGVCIDLAQARSIDDRGVVALSEAVRGRAVSSTVRLLGLRQHHVRVLRYHGADVVRLGLGPALL
jgi:uncharacterized MnhB-related membrane protein